jgi:hypothetical protein
VCSSSVSGLFTFVLYFPSFELRQCSPNPTARQGRSIIFISHRPSSISNEKLNLMTRSGKFLDVYTQKISPTCFKMHNMKCISGPVEIHAAARRSLGIYFLIVIIELPSASPFHQNILRIELPSRINRSTIP